MNFFCRGWSMKRVFCPGDTLECRRVPKEEIRRGDVICFPGEDGEGIAHRVIRILPDGFVTMGDNNAERDRNPVRGESFPVAYAVLSHGRRRRIPGGGMGLLSFYRNRILRRSRLFSGWLFSRIHPLFFWRIPCSRLTLHRFGGEDQYYFRGRLVVRRRKDGLWEWSSPWWRMMIKIKNQE